MSSSSADRAPVGALDGIVVVELSLDVRHEIENVVGCLRAGAAALMALPVAATNYGEKLSRKHTSDQVFRFADEIEAEARRVTMERAVAYRERAQHDAKVARQVARARTAARTRDREDA